MTGEARGEAQAEGQQAASRMPCKGQAHMLCACWVVTCAEQGTSTRTFINAMRPTSPLMCNVPVILGSEGQIMKVK